MVRGLALTGCEHGLLTGCAPFKGDRWREIDGAGFVIRICVVVPAAVWTLLVRCRSGDAVASHRICFTVQYAGSLAGVWLGSICGLLLCRRLLRSRNRLLRSRNRVSQFKAARVGILSPLKLNA
jgi:hypothetical protein